MVAMIAASVLALVLQALCAVAQSTVSTYEPSVDVITPSECSSLLAIRSQVSKTNLGRKASWISSLHDSEHTIYSQNGEDGVILTLVGHLNLSSKYYVEFGVQDGTERNTRALQEMLAWQGLLIDGSHENASINLQKQYIKEENVVNLFEQYKVPKSFGLLSVDIDSYDFWVLKQLLENGYTPDLIVTEVNSQIEPGLFTVPPENVTGLPYLLPGASNFGASPEAFSALAGKHGYVMVYCESRGVNCFFVRRSLLSYEEFSSIPKQLRQSPQYVNNGGGKLACWPAAQPPLPWYEFLSLDLSTVNKAATPKMIEGCIEVPATSLVQFSNLPGATL